MSRSKTVKGVLIIVAVYAAVLGLVSWLVAPKPYAWRAVDFHNGTYGVAACTIPDDVCATDGIRMTGYRFDNPDDAKEQAAKLEAVHQRQAPPRATVVK